MQQLKTLEDLRLYLEKKYQENESKFNKSQPLEIINYLNIFTNDYDLTSEEYDYVMPYGIDLQEQTNQKTLINSKKALEILLKRK